MKHTIVLIMHFFTNDQCTNTTLLNNLALHYINWLYRMLYMIQICAMLSVENMPFFSTAYDDSYDDALHSNPSIVLKYINAHPILERYMITWLHTIRIGSQCSALHKLDSSLCCLSKDVLHFYYVHHVNDDALHSKIQSTH